MSFISVFLIFKWFVPVFFGFTGDGGLRMKVLSVKYKVLQLGWRYYNGVGFQPILGAKRPASA